MEKVLRQILGELKALRSDVTGLQKGRAHIEKGQDTQGRELKELRQGQK